MTNTVFITGATGSVGSHLALTLLTWEMDTDLVVLVRGDSASAAADRFEKTLRTLVPGMDYARFRDRVTILTGDITRERLGLSASAVRAIAPRITHIVHAAATTEFHLPLECARLVNCTGTRNVLNLATHLKQHGRLRHVAHISTAYVCGGRSGAILETDQVAGKGTWSNSYEQSKCETEHLVQAAMANLPISVFRPSIVVGDSQTGRTTAFNALYAPLRLIERGLITALPAFATTLVDVVPADYVTAAICHILFHSSTAPGDIYHLVAGPDNNTTVADVIGGAVRLFNEYRTASGSSGPRIPPVAFVPPASWDRQYGHGTNGRVDAGRAVGVYAPYTSISRQFDDSKARGALRGTGIYPSPLADYYDRILRYCLETAWGRTVRRAA